MKAVALATALATLLAASVSQGDDAPTWERAFDASAAPAKVHFRGSYVDGKGKEHRFEVWRQGDARLVRNTDDRLILHVMRGDDGAYVYKLVDKARRLLIDVRPENLYRLGRFTDWTSISTMLERPAQPHRIVDGGRSQTTSLGACRWFRIELGEHAEEICWSRAWALPLLMRAPASKAPFQFKIDAADRDPKPAAFRIDEQGLVPVHADEDIHPSD
jgi:hypothetical protein